jgi:hypothetical protein
MIYLTHYKNFVFLIIVYTLPSTKLEIRAEQFLPGSEGMGERGGVEGSGEKWLKHFIHI